MSHCDGKPKTENENKNKEHRKYANTV